MSRAEEEAAPLQEHCAPQHTSHSSPWRGKAKGLGLRDRAEAEGTPLNTRRM